MPVYLFYFILNELEKFPESFSLFIKNKKITCYNSFSIENFSENIQEQYEKNKIDSNSNLNNELYIVSNLITKIDNEIDKQKILEIIKELLIIFHKENIVNEVCKNFAAYIDTNKLKKDFFDKFEKHVLEVNLDNVFCSLK